MWALDKSGPAAPALTPGRTLEAGSLGARAVPWSNQGPWPARGRLAFVSEAPPYLLAKEAQEILAENTVPWCPAEMTTSWGAREEGAGK